MAEEEKQTASPAPAPAPVPTFADALKVILEVAQREQIMVLVAARTGRVTVQIHGHGDPAVLDWLAVKARENLGGL